MVEHIIPITSESRDAVSVMLEAAETHPEMCVVILVRDGKMTIRGSAPLTNTQRLDLLASAAEVLPNTPEEDA